MPKGDIAHDKILFEAVLEAAHTIEPTLRVGSMFGGPAIFVGRKMAACVFGGEVGLKVPADIASTSIASGNAKHFTPYGKSKMREWISVTIQRDQVDRIANLLSSSLKYARDNN